MMFETILLAALLAALSAAPAQEDPLSARRAAEEIRSGSMTSEALTRKLLARAEAARGLNAFISLDVEQAIAEARAADAATRRDRFTACLSWSRTTSILQAFLPPAGRRA